MNTSKVNQKQAASSIKSLRSYDSDSKPLHIMVISSISNAFAMTSRFASCKTQSGFSFDSTKSKSVSNERFVINEFGRWSAAKQ